MPTHPQKEFSLINKQIDDLEPRFSYFDIDGARVKCYWNVTNRTGPALPKLDFAETNEDRDQILEAVVTDMSVDTADEFFSIKLTPTSLTLITRDPALTLRFTQFTLFNNGKKMAAEEVHRLSALGFLKAPVFDKNKEQKFPHDPPVAIDEAALERRRKEINLPPHFPVLPRTSYFRQPATQKSIVKKRLAELNSSAYTILGAFDEGQCPYNVKKTSTSYIQATCLPVAAEKDRCETVDVEPNSDGCGRTVKIACTRLCRIREIAKQVYEQVQVDPVVCVR